MVLFADDDYEIVGPDDLCYVVARGGVARVALGRWEVWHVLFQDGTECWSGGLPIELYNQLHSRSPRLPRPVYVALGPSDEWFVCYADGKWRAGGMHNDLEVVTDNVNGIVRRVMFGGEDIYVVAYEG